MPLFRLLDEGKSLDIRSAAGRALSLLWARDDLIPEEEKALVRRGFEVSWQARKRYPRGLGTEIPIGVHFGVPFLREEGPGVEPRNLEWSHKIAGARRASLELFTPFEAGNSSARFTIVPGDFETDGPHRLVLEAKVRTAGLTAAWVLNLPHSAFSFEFDPLLAADALLASPDEARAQVFKRSVRLEETGTDEAPSFLELNESLAVRRPPELVVETPLPCDLAHRVFLEIDGVSGRVDGGRAVVSGQGMGATPAARRRLPLELTARLPADAIERPGARRLRAILTADPQLGWADPDVRSIWPGTIETGWVDVEIVRK
jgi:hypothetical protein